MRTTIEALLAVALLWAGFYWTLGYLEPRRTRVRAAAKAEDLAIRRAREMWKADR